MTAARSSAQLAVVSGQLETSEVRDIELALLDANTGNPRRTINKAELAELAASIGEVGITQPLLVRPSPASTNGRIPESSIAPGSVEKAGGSEGYQNAREESGEESGPQMKPETRLRNRVYGKLARAELFLWALPSNYVRSAAEAVGILYARMILLEAMSKILREHPEIFPLLLMFALVTHLGAQIPDAPAPHPDRVEWALVAADAASRALDTYSTRRMLVAGNREVFLPAFIVDHTCSLASFEGSAVGLNLLAVRALERHHHARLAHALPAIDIANDLPWAIRNLYLPRHKP